LNKEIWCNTCKLKLLTKRLTYFTMFTIDVIMDFEFMSSYLTKKEVYYKVLDYIQNKYEYRKDLPEDYLVNTLMQEIYKPGEYYEEEE
jgi:hypothetical protein